MGVWQAAREKRGSGLLLQQLLGGNLKALGQLLHYLLLLEASLQEVL